MRAKFEIIEEKRYKFDSKWGVWTVRDVETGSITEINGVFASRPSIGDTFDIEYTEKQSERFGKQKSISMVYDMEMPLTIRGVENLLGKNFAFGIGPESAKHFVGYYKEETFNVLDRAAKGIRQILEAEGLLNDDDDEMETTDDATMLRDLHDEFRGGDAPADNAETVEPESDEDEKKRLNEESTRLVGILKTMPKDIKQRVMPYLEPLLEPNLFDVGRALTLASTWIVKSEQVGTMRGLISYGISDPKIAKLLLRKLGPSASERIKENPWLLQMAHMPFSKIDVIAASLGHPPDDPRRIQAAGNIVLEQLTYRDGSTCIDRDIFEREFRLMACKRNGKELSREDAAGVMSCMRDTLEGEEGEKRGFILTREYSEDPECDAAEFVESWHIKRREESIAQAVATLYHDAQEYGVRADHECMTRVIKILEEKNNRKYDASQVDAVHKIIESPIAILSGGPGTGKTTLEEIIFCYYDAMNMNIAGAAPTGIAASRASTASGHEFRTIHSLLKIDPKTNRMGGGIDGSISSAVFDESGMLGLPVASNIFRAVTVNGVITDTGFVANPHKGPGWQRQVLLVGDVDQLRPIDPGSVFSDLIQSGAVPVFRLDKVWRQSEGGIATNAMLMRQIKREVFEQGMRRAATRLDPASNINGEFTVFTEKEIATGGDMRRFDNAAPAVIQDQLLPLLQKMGFGHEDVQILVPIKEGPVGAFALNEIVREWANPRPTEGPLTRCPDLEMRLKNSERGTKWSFRPGDRIVTSEPLRKKEYSDLSADSVVNGERGYVRRTGMAGSERWVEVEFPAVGEVVMFHTKSESEALPIIPAYALTIHKAQGSEYPVVIPVLSSGSIGMLTWSMYYTACTRAKQKCITMATSHALNYALHTFTDFSRKTLLADTLREIAVPARNAWENGTRIQIPAPSNAVMAGIQADIPF